MSSIALRFAGDRPSLVAFFLHGLFESREEAESGLVDPYQPVLVSELRTLIDHFRHHGYRFIGPDDILAGLRPDGHYALLTFDDGYASNLRVLPLLREFQASATLFVSANHVAEGRAFWWDALYRERKRRGASRSDIAREQEHLKARPHWEIEAFLCQEFGANALRPRGDVDRPMTEAELKEFAGSAGAVIGNHTCDHAILPAHPDDAILAQISGCQRYLERLTGKRPTTIAYPNGRYNETVLRIARSEGLLLGVTVEHRKSRLPVAAEANMLVPRFFLEGNADIVAQCLKIRSGV